MITKGNSQTTTQGTKKWNQAEPKIEIVIKSLKNNKAAGQDRICEELLNKAKLHYDMYKVIYNENNQNKIKKIIMENKH